MAMEWIDELRAALDREQSALASGAARGVPRVATLATVDRSGAPHARGVICRRIDPDGQLYFVSDARSNKNLDVRGEPRVEVVFWMPAVQTQFRVAGEMRVTSLGQDEPLRRELWRELTDETRALFHWPTPGIAVAADETYPRAVSADVLPPGTFEVLILKPSQVERLNISTFPHRRRRWRSEASWSGVDVNP
jgi:PPOX class probable FMN-dependent enzyme